MLDFQTAGESHGKGIVTVVSGFPSQLEIDPGFIQEQLSRRQGGFGSGPRMQMEKDEVEILSGIRWKKTIGAPIVTFVRNKDFSNWEKIMDPLGDRPFGYQDITIPRPGHADLSGAVKYHFRDLRNVIERASARETVGRCVAGSLARLFLRSFGIQVGGFVESIAGIISQIDVPFQEKIKASLPSPIYTFDLEKEREMIQAIEKAKREGDSVGGTFIVVASGVVPGLGGYCQTRDRIDARLAAALMSIPSVKGVEIGDGFLSSRLLGSQVHDEMGYCAAKKPFSIFRKTNHSGGIEGGTSTGEPIWVRCAMKPIPTLRKELVSVDIKTREEVSARYERSDVCAVPRGLVVGESMVAWVLAQTVQEKLGGDSMDEILDRFQAYLLYLERFPD
ncbi:MAG: chorismate synthase [Candidatus Atribacteria bacterium]|nr:chorismate synthase [Candidatus Atribacteria bacterium]